MKPDDTCNHVLASTSRTAPAVNLWVIRVGALENIDLYFDLYEC